MFKKYANPFTFYPFLFLMKRLPPISTLFPYTTLFRSHILMSNAWHCRQSRRGANVPRRFREIVLAARRSEEHTSELQSHVNLVCRLLLEKKKKKLNANDRTYEFLTN